MPLDPPVVNPNDLALLRRYYEKYCDRNFLLQKGAHGVGIGRKVEQSNGGKVTGFLCLRVYVKEKIHNGLPPEIEVLREIEEDGHPLLTDVYQCRQAVYEARTPPLDPQAIVRPVCGGVGVRVNDKKRETKGGTMGGWAWDLNDDSIVMLSNEHVLGHEPGHAIIQPVVGNGRSHRIGRVKTGIAPDRDGDNTVDCATGRPEHARHIDPRVERIGPGIFAVERGSEEMQVEMYGSTSRHSRGMIVDEVCRKLIPTDYGEMLYSDLIMIEGHNGRRWSRDGDSGALVFSQTPIAQDSPIKPAVGLHFAGDGKHGYACRIQNVFKRLNLTTLAAGTFAYFADALIGAEAAGGVSRGAQLRLEAAAAANAGAASVPNLQAFAENAPGGGAIRYNQVSGVSDRVARFRAQLLMLLTADFQVRAAVARAFRSILAGAVTSTALLEQRLNRDELLRLEELVVLLSRKGGAELEALLKPFGDLKRWEGQSLAEILQLGPREAI